MAAMDHDDVDFGLIDFTELQSSHHHDRTMLAPNSVVFPIIGPKPAADIAQINDFGDFMIGAPAADVFPITARSFPYKMTAVGVYKPKHMPLGEDACFIWSKFQTVGVADGVGGWRKLGVDSGEYARRLMANCVLALCNETLGYVNPMRVLHQAFNATAVRGSSTACIITLSGDKLTAANVGDSGFLVIRNDAVVFRSPTQQKCFNCPFQLGTTMQDPSVADLMEVAVISGDIVVAGTDGLLDNMHESEIVEIAGNSKIRDDNYLCQQAYYMAKAAHYNSMDPDTDSPYSIEARKAGRNCRGGKPDDITIIIARIDDDNDYDDDDYSDDDDDDDD